MRYVPFNERLGSGPQVTVPVADVNDTGSFPNIAAAIDWARKRRASNDLR